jgi:hypothetical protein
MKLNGWQVYGKLTRPMTGRTAEQYIEENYRENQVNSAMLVRAAWDYGISARAAASGCFAVHIKSRNPPRFIIEEASLAEIIVGHGPVNSESNRAERPVSVAPRPVIRYNRAIASVPSINAKPLREKVMATRTAPSKSKPKSAPVEEPEEVDEELEDEELEDEDDELDDEDDEELEDDEDDEDDEEEDEDEDDEEEDEDEDVEGSDEPDYTPYASKPITATMQDFADWMDFAIFEPVGESVAEIGASDPTRLIAIAGTARMEFQRSDFNKERRAERQAAAASAKAEKAKAPKAKPVAKGSPTAKSSSVAKPVAKGKPTAKPVARAAAPAAKPAAKAKAAPTKSTTGGRTATRKRGAAPY